MKVKIWLKYLIYIILILAMVFLRESKPVASFFNKKDFSLNYSSVIISTLLGVGIGIVLGLEHFLNEIRKDGRWKLDFPKLLVIGIPALYLALTNLFLYSSIPIFQNVIVRPSLYLFLSFSVGYVTIFQLILGYILITSINKYRKE